MVDKIKVIETKEVFSYFPVRNEESNKGDYGRALIIGGSYGMAGAAVIAARACVTSGVGICEVACPDAVYPIAAAQIPEAVFTPISAASDSISDADINKIRRSIKKADCVAVGCGTGRSNYTRRLLDIAVAECDVPLIIDADGINCLSENINMLKQAKCPIILTPHPGEMARLIGKTAEYVQKNRMSIAADFADEYGVILVLKGHHTIISAKNSAPLINMRGNSGMATGGSGDMLCGITAAFCAEGISPLQAAAAAVHIHSLAGDLCAAKYSKISTTPSRMTEMLPIIFSDIESTQQGV